MNRWNRALGTSKRAQDCPTLPAPQNARRRVHALHGSALGVKTFLGMRWTTAAKMDAFFARIKGLNVVKHG